jgi:hypothetical protein
VYDHGRGPHAEAIQRLAAPAWRLLSLHHARASSPAHCQRRPDRQGGCDTDGPLPVFRFDENVLKGMRDAD